MVGQVCRYNPNFVQAKAILDSGRLGELTKEFLSFVDVLVDGPFVEEKKNLSLRFRGSSNQRIIDVPASLQTGEIVLWEDWQGYGKERK